MLKASLLYPMGNAKSSTERNYDERRKTKNGAKTNAAGWLGSGLFRRSLFPEGRTYSPPPKCAAFRRRWYPSRWSGRALCEARLRFAPVSEGDAGCFVLCGERRTFRALLLSSAAGGISVIARPARRLVVAIRFPIGNAARLFAKSATAQGTPFGCGRFGKWERIATAPSELRNDGTKNDEITKGGFDLWRSIIWKRPSSAGARVVRPARRQPI